MTKRVYNKDNIFYQIITGAMGADIIYETPYTICFYDIAPKQPFHLLVLTKGLYIDLNDFLSHGSSEEIADYWRVINTWLKFLQTPVDTKGSFSAQLTTNGGTYQEIPHFHSHILSAHRIDLKDFQRT